MHQRDENEAATPLTVTWRSREFIAAAVLVTFAPATLLIANWDWFFTSETYLDPWHYVGLFHQYLDPNYSPGAYKLARLPWILSGFLAHRALDPISAAFTLHAFYWWAASLALFVALYALFGRLALAGVVATMFGFYTHAHGSGSWDYHNAAAGAFYLLAVMLLALPAAIDGRRPVLVLTGAITALAIHTNITLVNFLPVLAFIHLTMVRLRVGQWPPVRDLARRAGWGLLGAVFVTVILGLVNWLAGREFLFFGFLTTLVFQYVADPQRHQGAYHRPWSTTWVLSARYLALPAAVLAIGVLYLLLGRRSTTHRSGAMAPPLVGTFLVMSLVWISWQSAGQTALDWNYFAYPLIPPCFLAIAGVLSRGWPDTLERHCFATIVATAFVCLAALSTVPRVALVEGPLAPVIALAGAAVFAAGFLAYLLRPSVAVSIAVIVVFAAGNRLVAFPLRDYAASDPCKVQAPTYAAVVDAAEWLWTLDPTNRRVRTWFDQDEKVYPQTGCDVSVGAVGYAVTSMAAVPYATSPFPMPPVDAIPETALYALANDHAVLAIIGDATRHAASWNQRLLELGLTIREVARHEISIAASRFTLQAWEVVSTRGASSEDASFGPPTITISDRTPPNVNMYGVPKGEVADRGDRVIVTPNDPRDHIEYGLMTLPASANARRARVTIESWAGNPESCQVEIKDPGFNVLAAFGCGSAVHHVTLPAGLPALRVYVSDLSSRPFVLPKKVEIALAAAGK